MSQVTIGPHALDDLGGSLRALGLAGRAYILTDRTVEPLYGPRVVASLRVAGYDPVIRSVPAGEKSKSLDTAFGIYDWLVDHRAERSDVIVALGGGVVGDLAGVIAATYLRGMPFVQAPTTLIAQVDSSIGGKVAVNHPRGKNLIGAFNPARLIVIDVGTLATLPARELASGWAEVIKTGFIRDETMLANLEQHADALMQPELALTTPIVERSVRLKLDVVAEDPTEKGIRIILNYGHTIAHALEAMTNYEVFAHGEAVAIGMMGAAEISRRVGLLDAAVVARQETCLRAFGLPTRLSDRNCPPLSIDGVLDTILLDKKVKGGKVRWVLLEGVGRTTVRDDVPRSLVGEVCRNLA